MEATHAHGPRRASTQPDSIVSVQWTVCTVVRVVIGGVGTLEGPLLVVLFAPRGLWGLLDPHRRHGLFPVGHRLASAAGAVRSRKVAA